MAKKIRFPMKMNNVDIRTIEELQENFDIEAVLGYYTSGKLVTWLRDRYYNEEADNIEALSADDEQFSIKLAKALGVEIEADENLDIEEVRLRREKLEMLSRYISDLKILDNMDIVAIDQDDLYDILDSGAEKVYLFKETFSVPTRKSDVTYIGLNGAKVKLQGKTDYDFNAVKIRFENVEFSLSDNAEELYHIAACYYNGNGVTLNYEEAFKLSVKAAKYGNSDAMCMLGYCYSYGRGVNIDYEEAFKWYTKAAESDNADAMYEVGECYYYGRGVEEDENESINWYIKAYEHGRVEIAHEIAEINYNQENYREAIKWYEISLNQGNENAKEELGECYYKIGEQYRKGNSEDRLINALENYKKSAEYGNIEGIYKVGDAYACWFCDSTAAFEWKMRAANKGYAEAQYDIGFIYQNGSTVPQDYEKAAEWYRKSAAQGCRYAEKGLGELYYYGNGVPQDYQMAVEWFRKAVEHHAYGAESKLGDCYFYGNGVDKNYYEAVKWYEKGAEYFDVDALVGLADCYSTQDCGFRDLAEAKKWIEAAREEEADSIRFEIVDSLIMLGDIGDTLNSINW